MARSKKTVEEKVALIDVKIEQKKAEIQALEEKKHRILHPLTAKTIMEKAKAAGMSLEDIAQKLDLDI